MDLNERLKRTILTNLFIALCTLGPFAVVFALKTPSINLYL